MTYFFLSHCRLNVFTFFSSDQPIYKFTIFCQRFIEFRNISEQKYGEYPYFFLHDLPVPLAFFLPCDRWIYFEIFICNLQLNFTLSFFKREISLYFLTTDWKFAIFPRDRMMKFTIYFAWSDDVFIDFFLQQWFKEINQKGVSILAIRICGRIYLKIAPGISSCQICLQWTIPRLIKFWLQCSVADLVLGCKYGNYR